MFGPITVPYDSVMLFNVCKLKEGVKFDEVEMAIADVCSKTKDTQDGFIAGQVFSYAGFISPEGSIGAYKEVEDHFQWSPVHPKQSIESIMYRAGQASVVAYLKQKIEEEE